MPQYKRPPIVEAVIDVRFKTPLTHKQIEKFQKKLNKDYPISKDIHKDFGIVFKISKAGPEPQDFKKGVVGKRLETNDAEWVIILYPEQLTFARRAPYTNWKDFFTAFQDVWKALKTVAALRVLTRLAVRYVNRIDIPLAKGISAINIADYLNVGVTTPNEMSVDGYEAILGVKINENTQAVVRTAAQEPTLPKTAALLLDVDLFIHSSLPDNDTEIYKSLKWLREQKNELFEKFITDKSKILFDREIV